MGSCNGTSNGSLLVLVSNTLAGEVCGTTLGHLQDERRLRIAGSLERGDYGGGGGNVDSWDGELLLLGVLEEVLDIICAKMLV